MDVTSSRVPIDFFFPKPARNLPNPASGLIIVVHVVHGHTYGHILPSCPTIIILLCLNLAAQTQHQLHRLISNMPPKTRRRQRQPQTIKAQPVISLKQSTETVQVLLFGAVRDKYQHKITSNLLTSEHQLSTLLWLRYVGIIVYFRSLTSS